MNNLPGQRITTDANVRLLLTAQDNRSSGYDYVMCVGDLPECISENDEVLPVRWKAPECLRQHSYSTASDVWAFAALMYEVLTLGCRPYRHIIEDGQVANYVLQEVNEEFLPQEPSIDDDEYKLMKQSLKRRRNERINLLDLKEELNKMRLKIKSGEETPRRSPDQLVPQNDHLYGNMQEKVDGVTNTRSLLGTDSGLPHIEAHYQEQETSPQLDHALHDIASNNSAGVSGRNPIAPSWLNHPKLEATFYV